MDFSTRLLDLERRMGVQETLEIPAASSVQGFTQGSVLFANASGQITQNNSRLFWDDANERLVVGSNVITLAGQSRFAIRGNGSDASTGPHISAYTYSDVYPLMQMLNFAHDNVNISFDAYYDGSWKSSDAGSNYQIRKQADAFGVYSNTGTAQGSSITTWLNPMLINSAGSLIETITTGNTTSTGTVILMRHNSTGTPGVNFGAQVFTQLDSSTTPNQNASVINTYWTTATHASRQARMDFIVHDTAGRVCLSLEAGGVPQFAVLGAAPIPRQTGGAKTADLTYGPDERDMLNIAYAALRNFGFLT